MMNPPPPPPPRRPDFPQNPSQNITPEEVAIKQARMEQMVLESRLELVRTQRQMRESKVNRRLMFVTCFVVSGFMAYVLDKKGNSPEVSFLGCVLTFVLIAAWWSYKKPFT
jgi:hypothetical protein